MSPGRQPDCTILFPPQWLPLNPHLSICSLAGYLRARHHDVRVVDLNVAFFRYVLSERYLRYSLQRSLNAHEYLYNKLFLDGLTGRPAAGQHAREAAWFLEIERLLKDRAQHWTSAIASIEEAVGVFDDAERFYDPCQLVHAFTAIDQALELASLPFFPTRLSFADFRTPDCPFTVEGLQAFTADRRANPFIAFYESVIDEIVLARPRVAAISVNASAQVVGGLTLARMLRERVGHETHVCIGGNYFPRVKDAFLGRPDFFETFTDSLVLFEGEEPLEKLVRAVRDERPLDEVPRMLHLDRDVGEVRYTFDCKPADLDGAGIQDLGGLALDKYFSPHRVVSTRSSKGCYWQKCTFCDAGWGMEPAVRSVDALLEEVRTLRDRFGVTAFEFIDEAIFPEHMETFARRVIDEKLDIAWFCNGRTEEAFTPQRLDLFARAGLKMILWGVESGSARIMRLINKGVPLDRRLDVLRAASQAGLWNFAFVFFGFPGETREEAMETIALLVDHQDIIHSYGKSIFTLGKHAPVSQQGVRQGVLRDVSDRQELSSSLDFAESDGMSREEVLEMSDLCRTLYACAADTPLWMVLRHREILLLYLQHHGRDFMQTFRFTPDQVAAFSNGRGAAKMTVATDSP